MGNTSRRSLGPPFRTLWTASTASNLGDGVLVAAAPLLARTLTDSALGVASVTVAATLPWLAFGLLAGVVVDRSDKRRLMVCVDVVRAVALVAATTAIALGQLSLPLLVVVVFLLGATETLFDTAAQALLPSLVHADDLETANGRLFGGQLVANSFLGPPLGGILVGVAVTAPLLLDAITFALSALLVMAIRPTRAPRPRAPVTSVRADLVEGLRWLWQQPTVRALAIGAAVVNLAHTGALAVLVLLVRDELGAGTTAYGLVLGASAFGALAGTQVSSMAARALGRRRALLASVSAFAAGLALTGTAPHAVVVALGLGVFGLGGEVWNVIAVSYRQARVPDELLGRVMATYRFVAYGAMPVGAALGGVLAGVDLRAPFLVGAAVTLALAVYIARVTAGDASLGHDRPYVDRTTREPARPGRSRPRRRGRGAGGSGT